MVVGGAAHAGGHVAVQSMLGDILGVAPGPGRRLAGHGAVAGEGELAAGPVGSLEHHAADRFGVARMAHAVEHHLGHRLLALAGLQGGLVVDGRGQAIDGLGALGRAGLEHEGLGGRIGGDGLGHHRIDALGVGHAEASEAQGRLGVDVQPRPSGGAFPQAIGAVGVVAEGDLDHPRRGVGHVALEGGVGEAAGRRLDQVVGAIPGDLLGQGALDGERAGQGQHDGQRQLQRGAQGVASKMSKLQNRLLGIASARPTSMPRAEPGPPMPSKCVTLVAPLSRLRKARYISTRSSTN